MNDRIFRWLPLGAKKTLWRLYRLLPGKRSVKFNLPGPTSSSHPFGWFAN